MQLLDISTARQRWQRHKYALLLGMALIKPPKICNAPPKNLVDVQGYVDKTSNFLQQQKYAEVPRWVRQRRILRILLVTGL